MKLGEKGARRWCGCRLLGRRVSSCQIGAGVRVGSVRDQEQESSHEGCRMKSSLEENSETRREGELNATASGRRLLRVRARVVVVPRLNV